MAAGSKTFQDVQLTDSSCCEKGSYCMSQMPVGRYGSDCLFNDKVVGDYNDPRYNTFFGFWKAYFASWRGMRRIEYCVCMPFYYLLGILYVLLKLVLNPPFCDCLMMNMRFEYETAFPGKDQDSRAAFAQQWFGAVVGTKRPDPFKDVPTFFNYDPNSKLWLERFNIFPWFFLPAMVADCVLDEERKAFLVNITRWHPHFMVGHVVIEDDPQKTYWLAWGNFKCWFFLYPLYKFAITRVFGNHVLQMGLVVKKLDVSISDPMLFGSWFQKFDINFKGVEE
jgi:hypothetical protein